jgi:SAM-dependent methyltransferase
VNAWDGSGNLSAYAEVEAAGNYASRAELDAYRRERLRMYDAQIEFLRRLGAPPEGLRVVDLGSGSSAFLYALDGAGLLARGVGIEISESRHAFAEQWRVELGLGHVTNLCANFVDVDLAEASFDRFTVIDDTYLLLRPENERYPDALLDTARRVLAPGGLLVAAFRNDAPVVASLERERTFWVELPESNAFRYALYRQEASADRQLLRTESIYITRDLTERRKVEVTEVCDVDRLTERLRARGFGAVSLYADFAGAPFDSERSGHVVLTAERG